MYEEINRRIEEYYKEAKNGNKLKQKELYFILEKLCLPLIYKNSKFCDSIGINRTDLMNLINEAYYKFLATNEKINNYSAFFKKVYEYTILEEIRNKLKYKGNRLFLNALAHELNEDIESDSYLVTCKSDKEEVKNSVNRLEIIDLVTKEGKKLEKKEKSYLYLYMNGFSKSEISLKKKTSIYKTDLVLKNAIKKLDNEYQIKGYINEA